MVSPTIASRRAVRHAQVDLACGQTEQVLATTQGRVAARHWIRQARASTYSAAVVGQGSQKIGPFPQSVQLCRHRAVLRDPITETSLDAGELPVLLRTGQVFIYLKWMRYLLDVSLRDKKYVVLNVDETSISQVSTAGHGLVSRAVVRTTGLRRMDASTTDRTDVKTTLLGLVCDQPDLQPLLPQVILPKYTQNAIPPQWAIDEFAQQGFPFQFWHRTSGFATSRIMCEWALAVRSAVHSWRDDVWIVLVLDCSSVHVDAATLQRLAHLGLLVVLIPGKCTWLLQPLDVYVFAELKAMLRSLAAGEQLERGAEKEPRGAWISRAARSVRSVLVQRDWSSQFARLGCGLDLSDLRDDLMVHLPPGVIMPALPTRHELARLLNRPADTDVTKEIHRALCTPAIRADQAPAETMPRRGAIQPLPMTATAQRKRRREHSPADAQPLRRVREHLTQRRGSDAPCIPGWPHARQVVVEPSHE